jgi:hypothetical protein
MGFDFFGADVDMKICLQQGVELNPGRYSVSPTGQPVRNPEDPDVVTVGLRTQLGTTPGSSEITLQGGNVGGDQTELPLGFFRSMMTRFQMEIGFSQIPKVQIDIEPPSNDLALAMLNSNVFAFGNALAVKFGYVNSPFEFFPGRGKDYELFFLLKPEVRFGDAITFTLHGLGTGMAMSQRAQRSILYKARSPKQIVSEIAQRAGLQMVEPNFVIAPGQPISAFSERTTSPTVAPGKVEWDSARDFEQTQVSDWAFLQEILSSIPGNLTFLVEGDRLVIQSEAQRLAGSPRAIFRWYHQPKLNAATGNLTSNDELPILNFNSDTNLAFFPMAAAGVATIAGVGRDSFTPAGNSTQSVAGKDTSTKKGTFPALGQTTLASPKLGNLPQITCGSQRMLPFGPLKGLEEAMQVAQAATAAPNSQTIATNFAQEGQFFGNWTAEITTIGVPTLRPGDLVLLKGFETVGTVVEKLNGNFLVKRMIHTLGPEGFETQLTLMRNSTPGEGVPVNGPVNAKTSTAPNTSTRSNLPMDAVLVTDAYA